MELPDSFRPRINRLYKKDKEGIKCMRECIEFIYRDVLENAPIIEEGTNYFIVDWGQQEQLVVLKDHVIRKYETDG